MAVLPDAVLPRARSRPLDLAGLLTLVRTVAAEDSWWPLVRFDSGGRWWAKLHGDATVDVWLLTWLTDQRTDLHDHGDAAAAFTVVQGSLEEVQSGARGTLTRRLLAPGESQWVAPGVVHDVRNPTPGPAVSIHAYSPPLRQMTYYRRTRRGLRAARTVLTAEPEQDVRR